MPVESDIPLGVLVAPAEHVHYGDGMLWHGLLLFSVLFVYQILSDDLLEGTQFLGLGTKYEFEKSG